MEQTREWTLLDELEDDSPISEQVAQRVCERASPGCLICALEEFDDE